jgi:hypothetical protein
MTISSANHEIRSISSKVPVASNVYGTESSTAGRDHMNVVPLSDVIHWPSIGSPIFDGDILAFMQLPSK